MGLEGNEVGWKFIRLGVWEKCWVAEVGREKKKYKWAWKLKGVCKWPKAKIFWWI